AGGSRSGSCPPFYRSRWPGITHRRDPCPPGCRGASMTPNQPAPAMSVILATSGNFTDIAATVHHLSRQSIVDRLELVLVARVPAALEAEPQVLRAFWGHQIIGVGPVASVGEANAAGVRAARATVVALAEDHCFPEPGWAEALLHGHEGPDVAAVGPVMRNA